VTLKRALAAVIALWLLALALVFQPHHNVPPTISHAAPLERPARDLPTLVP